MRHRGLNVGLLWPMWYDLSSFFRFFCISLVSKNTAKNSFQTEMRESKKNRSKTTQDLSGF